MMSRFRRNWQSLRVWWSQRNETTRALIQHILKALRNFGAYGASQAAALSYYAIFSIFPLTLLLAIGINRLLGQTVGEDQLGTALGLFLPIETVDLIQVNVMQAVEQAGDFTIVALLGLIWAGSGLFSNLSKALDRIFQVPSSRSMWRQRLLALAMALTLVVLVAASFVASGVMRLVTAFFLEQSNLWLTIGTVFLPFSLNLSIFILLFRYVPNIYVHWEAIWPAAIIGAMGWEVAKQGFAWYLETVANFALIYGSIATVIVLLLWAYLMSSILIISAELSARLNEWLEELSQQHDTSSLRDYPSNQLPYIVRELPPQE